MRLVCISDTHGRHQTLTLPAGDVLIHAGDCTSTGKMDETLEFLQWFSEVGDYAHRILVAGNHDFVFEDYPKKISQALPSNIHYLQDSGVELGGLKFWGSPYTPFFNNWAFNCRGQAIEPHWDIIPPDVDVLITHGPPYEVLDTLLEDGQQVGCPFLKRALERHPPKLHIFGHIHEEYGQVQTEQTHYVNASICNPDYRPVNAPVVVDLES